ncbi:MAG: ABC transporter ATP-binding protein [Chloroflexi bacterium]|nr:ABC transporter ATP-binding protein [Chloroflexota bacterium]
MAEIHIQEVRKTFGKVVAVNNVELTIHDQEFMVLLGPSGCGKTTLLRCLAGLEDVDSGRILINNEDVTEYPPRNRHIAMVFQSYAIFPHLSVFENIAFGLRMQHLPKKEIEKKVGSAAELLQIENLLERFPAQISGGQRQRVAVARAITVEADVLLMDEPLSNLDALLRLEMRAELKRLINELHTTVVYVTHDQVEALSLGDRIAVMKSGNLLQVDKPLEVYDHPATEFIGGFIGNPPMNFLPAVIDTGGVHVGETDLSLDLLPEGYKHPGSAQNVKIGIRAENVKVLRGPEKNALMGKIFVVEPLGSTNLLTVVVGKEYIKVNTHPTENFQAGEEIWMQMDSNKISWMDVETGVTLV